MERNTSEEAQFLAEYQVEKYERPSVTVDIVLLAIGNGMVENYRKLPEKKLKVLLIRREEHPFKNCWALPGVFATSNETLEQAALRGLQKKTGVDNLYLEQLYTIGTPNRDPRTWVITCAYMALVNQEKITHLSKEKETEWFEVSLKLEKQENIDEHEGKECRQYYRLSLQGEEKEFYATIMKSDKWKNGTESIEYHILENHGLAFDHAQILALAMLRLRGKIEYTDVAFHLVPEKFTLTELQNVYETVLDTELVPANFRRKLSDKVKETDEYAQTAGHRPSKLLCRAYGNE